MIFLAFIFIPILEIFIFMTVGSYLGKLKVNILKKKLQLVNPSIKIKANIIGAPTAYT